MLNAEIFEQIKNIISIFHLLRFFLKLLCLEFRHLFGNDCLFITENLPIMFSVWNFIQNVRKHHRKIFIYK